MALGGYTTGTISITAGDTVVTGASTIWNGANAREGDTLIVAGHQVVVNEVTDVGHLVIDAWPYSTVTAQTYRLAFTSPLRYGANAQMAKDVSAVLAVLNATGFFVFVGIDETEPDPSLGADGQYALQPSTMKRWHNDGGLWVADGYFGGFGIPAPYDNAHSYSLFEVATFGGSSYVWINSASSSGHAPPNATYWAVLASSGATGPASWALPVAWTTATAFVSAAPSSTVVINGSTYVCLIPHTSGVFATDLAAGKWQLVAQAAPIYNVSSTSSLLIAIASKAFTGVSTNNAYQVGDYVRAKSAANAANFMEGNVTSNSAGTLTVNVTKIGGSGTFADWNISITGAPGTGDVLSSNNGSEFTNTATFASNLGLIRYSGSQSLTAGQKKQVYINIGVREPLTGSRTYFVRTDGSDSNDGLTNSSGGAFLTPQKAFDIIAQTLDLAGQTITINLVSGVFAGFNVNGGWVGNGNIIVEMNSAATLRAPNAGVAVNTSVSLGGNLTVQNGTLDCATTSGTLINHNGPGNLRFGAITMNGGNSIGFDMVAAYSNCSLAFFGNITFGACSGFREIFYAHAGGYIDLYGGVSGLSMTMSGNMSWADSFCYAEANAFVNAVASARTISLGGFTMTGKRFTAAPGGAINSNGGGLTYFPGSIAGVPAAVSTAGTYS